MSLRRFFHRTRRDADHAQEFESFVEMETAENVARGMTEEEARRAARMKFGNPTSLREKVFEMNRIPFFETLARDLRYAARVLIASPTYTLVSLLTLALGIGATTAIFTVVNAVILRPLPFPDPERLVTAWETNAAYKLPGHPPGTVSFSPGNFLDLREQNRSFEQIGGFTTQSFNFTGGQGADRIAGGLISAGLLATLGVQPVAGRLLVAADDSASAERVAVLSYGLWVDRFGRNPAVIGSSLRLDDLSHTIVGVMPPGFRLFNSDVDVWLPLERKIAPETMHWRQSYYLRVIGRLKRGVSVEQARADVDRVMQQIRREHPKDLGQGGAAVPLLDNTIARARGPLWILFGAVGFVLLIACANVAHLSLGRAMARRREIALRLTLGAGRGRLLRQLFTESLALALLGAAAGVALAEWGVRALLRLAPEEIPRATEIHMDAWVITFATLAAIVSAVLFGLLPALGAAKADLQESIQGGGRSVSSGRGTQRTRTALVISEIAVALVLMIGAGLMIESFRRASAVNPGFEPRGLMAMRVALSANRYDSIEKQGAFYRRATERLREIPGVQSVGAIDGLPFSDGGFDNSFSIDGRADPPAGQALKADIRRIDTGYFQTMPIPLIAGRGFNDGDRTETPAVAIVSESMARKYWPGEPAVGKRLHIHFGPPEGIHAEIVGVAADVRPAFDTQPGEYIYMHYPQGRFVGQMDLVLRPAVKAEAIRAALSSIDPDQPLYRIRTMDDVLALSLATRRFQMMLLSIFAGLAVSLAAVGLYGVLAYSVQARTREIGIRTALGADNVARMILAEALKLASVGVAAGVAGAMGLTRLLASLLFGIKATDATTFLAVSLLLLAIAAVAGYLPARRAARIDPMAALRE